MKHKLQSLKKGAEEETGVKSTIRLKPLGPLSPGMRMLLQPETEPPLGNQFARIGLLLEVPEKETRYELLR